MPWVVLEQVWCSRRRFARFFHEPEGGWAFGAVSFRVLSAPMFDVFAPEDVSRRIVDAIRAAPARRAAEFATYERPAYEASGAYSAELLDQMTPPPNEPLRDASFRSPVLLVGADREGYWLLGDVVTFDVVLESLVRRRDIPIDRGLALLILLTCHGKPSDITCETQPDGSYTVHRGYVDSAFTQPFHPKRFQQIVAALLARCAGEAPDAWRAALNQLLVTNVPRAIASLRRRPPRTGHSLLSVARSRLAESVSDELSLSRTRVPRVPWWKAIDQLTDAERRRLSRALSPAERAVVRAVRRGERLPSHPSTARVHLGNAKAKHNKLLRNAPS